MAQSVAELALLSDCSTTALVTRQGTVEWWPGPRFDGPSAFSRLLDDDAGHFRVAPTGGSKSIERSYLDGTLVLQTEHTTEAGRMRVLDALALEPGARGHEIGLRSPNALVRVMEAVDADVDVEVGYRPRLEYGLAVPRLVRERGRVVSLGGPERLFLTDDGLLEVDGGCARGAFTLRAGERRGLLLRRGPGVEATPPEPLDPLVTLEETAAAWRSWAELHGGYDGPCAAGVAQAALVLQGLTWVALDRGVRLAGSLGEHARPARWGRARDEIREAVLGEAWHERRGAIAGTLGGDGLDAAVLLAPLVGFLHAGDERMRSTVHAIEAELANDGLVRRFEDCDEEGAFLPASFWLAACHALAGEPDRGRAIVEKAAACSTDVGLLAEMADSRTGEPLGNLPQALSHVGLVTAAQAIGDAEREAVTS